MAKANETTTATEATAKKTRAPRVDPVVRLERELAAAKAAKITRDLKKLEVLQVAAERAREKQYAAVRAASDAIAAYRVVYERLAAAGNAPAAAHDPLFDFDTIDTEGNYVSEVVA